jgi:hypothetical protein
MPRKSAFETELDAVRDALGGLSMVVVREHFGGPAFRIGGKAFALYWSKEHRRVMKLPHDRQMMLFESRSGPFQAMRSGRMIWSYVKIEDIAPDELKNLLVLAWRTMAPGNLANTIAQPRRKT